MFKKLVEKLYFSQKGNLALYDQFTGCLNRNWFERFASHQTGYVAVCDVNGLKKINDTLGHQAGDKLIANMSRTLLEAFPTSKVCRYGGDEFYIYCSFDPTDVLVQCRTSVNFSYGVEEIIGEESLNMADQKMYAMKHN